MGNKFKQIEIDKNHKDRGDLPRKLNLKEININTVMNVRKIPPDRGDSKKRIEAQGKEREQSSWPQSKQNLKRKELLNTQAANKSRDIIVRNKPEAPIVSYRTRIKDRYTDRLKDLSKISFKKDPTVKDDKSGDIMKMQSSNEPMVIRIEKLKEPSETKSDKSIRQLERKPIIKTITSKKDAVRVFKAVTFTDQPKKKTLQIKVPRAPVRKKEFESRIPKRVKTVSVHKIEQKPKKVKAKPGRIRSLEPITTPSPDFSAAKIISPPTEISKWAPSQKHTKLYYEAWVDTTLAAISHFSAKDKLFLEKQKTLQMFKKQLQHQPELCYEHYNDERYTGKITVKQR